MLGKHGRQRTGERQIGKPKRIMYNEGQNKQSERIM